MAPRSTPGGPRGARGGAGRRRGRAAAGTEGQRLRWKSRGAAPGHPGGLQDPGGVRGACAGSASRSTAAEQAEQAERAAESALCLGASLLLWLQPLRMSREGSWRRPPQSLSRACPAPSEMRRVTRTATASQSHTRTSN